MPGGYIMADKEIPYKIYLSEDELPTDWYNVRADMKNKPAPLLNPATHQPMTFADLQPVFCDELIKQELNDTDPYIPIPKEIRDFYKTKPSKAPKDVRIYQKEEWMQFLNPNGMKTKGAKGKGSKELKGEIPDFSEEGWAIRKPRKKK